MGDRKPTCRSGALVGSPRSLSAYCPLVSHAGSPPLPPHADSPRQLPLLVPPAGFPHWLALLFSLAGPRQWPPLLAPRAHFPHWFPQLAPLAGSPRPYLWAVEGQHVLELRQLVLHKVSTRYLQVHVQQRVTGISYDVCHCGEGQGVQLWGARSEVVVEVVAGSSRGSCSSSCSSNGSRTSSSSSGSSGSSM